MIWFTVWSSVAHAGVKAVLAVRDPADLGHFLGDVPGLALVAIVLGTLAPGGLLERAARRQTESARHS